MDSPDWAQIALEAEKKTHNRVPILPEREFVFRLPTCPCQSFYFVARAFGT